jgi:hypothetical protein
LGGGGAIRLFLESTATATTEDAPQAAVIGLLMTMGNNGTIRAGVIMRNACRKDGSQGGIRQCANSKVFLFCVLLLVLVGWWT